MMMAPLEYLSVIKRRRYVFATTFGLVFLSALLFAMNWSNYKAVATVEVTRPEISMDVVDTSNSGPLTAETIADLQISRLKQKVLSTSSLADIITKLNLYPDLRKTTPIAYIAEEMREDIGVQLLSTSLANPASAQKASALQLSAIAFTLSFKYSNPILVQKAVNELVSKFLEEDLADRRDTAKKTSDFLDGQIKILSENLEEQEKKIASFRSVNGNTRPDALAFNQQAAASTTTRILSLESEIISNLGVVGALRSQLAQIDPYARVLDESGQVLATPSTQLRALKSQYASLTAKYGVVHPDVVKVQRQMEALEADVDPSALRTRLKVQLEDVETKLQVALKEYGEDHPDVQSLRTQKSSLKTQIQSIKSGSSSSSGFVRDADNPAYLQVVAQLKSAQEQQKALEAQRDEVKQQEEVYRKAISENPAAEQQMAILLRDYDNIILLYRDLKAKKLASAMNETIEQGSIGQRLSVIETPQVPLQTSPPRKIFALAGFMFALMVGAGSVLALQILSQSVMGAYHVETLIGVAPLVTIPHLYTLEEKMAHKQLKLKMLMLFPLFILICLIAFFIVVMPFDIFTAMIFRKLGL